MVPVYYQINRAYKIPLASMQDLQFLKERAIAWLIPAFRYNFPGFVRWAISSELNLRFLVLFSLHPANRLLNNRTI